MRSSDIKISLGLFVAALLVRIAVVWLWQFDGLYGQDAYAYYDNAKVIHSAFPDLARIADEYWPVGKAAPIGYPASMALLFVFLGNDPMAGQLISLLAGSLVAPLLFLFTVKLLRLQSWEDTEATVAGVVAGILASISGVLVRSSTVVMSDALGLCLALIAVIFALRFEETQRLKSLLLLAIATALMIIVRISNGLIALVIIAYIFFYVFRRHGIPAVQVSLSSLAGLVILLPQLWLINHSHGAVVTESAVGNWKLGNILSSHFETLNGQQDYMLPNFLFYLAPIVYPSYLTPLMLPALVAGVAVSAKRKNGRSLILLLGWIVIVYVVLVGSPLQNLRYAETYFPPVSILAGIGFASIVRRWNLRNSVQLLWIGISVLSMAIPGFFSLDKFLEIKATEMQVVQWVDVNTSTETNILSFGITPALKHYARRNISELYYQDTTSLGGILQPGKALVILDQANIETQWRGTRLLTLVSWIREHYSLTEMERVKNYTVFRVGKAS